MSKSAAIIELHRAGHSNSKIMKLLKSPKSTVRDTILRFQELEKEACSSPHNNLEDLRASLKRAWEKIPQDALRAACQNFRQRLQRVIDADGGHFE